MDTGSGLAVPEETVLAACGDVELPRMGQVEQVWETDPIPTDELPDRAGAAVGSLRFAGVPDGGEVAVGVGSRGPRAYHLPRTHQSFDYNSPC